MPRCREEDADLDEDYEALELKERGRPGGGGSRRKRGRSNFIDDHAEEDSQEDEDDGGRGGKGSANKRKKLSASIFLDREARQVDDQDAEEEEEEGEDDFIVDAGTDLPGERVDRGYHGQRFLSREEDDEDVEDLERRIQERYSRHHEAYDEEATDVEQQALLPSVRDPKLWLVKCAIGREREAAVCLMQKFIDRGADSQIRSVVALDHLKNYIYVEADKEAHVKEAIKGMRNIYANQKILLVPTREMTDVLSVERKAFDLCRDTWVRKKIGSYKGDLAKVFDVGNVRQRATVNFGGLSTLFPNRKKGHFMKGDAVIVVKGDLKNLKGWVEKVDEENVLIRSGMKGLQDPLAVNERELCKYFEPGNLVKVVSGTHEGATGMVVKVDQHVLIIVSDTTKEHLRVFADHVVGGSRSGAKRNGGDSIPRFDNFKAHAPVSSSPRKFQRGGIGYNYGGRHKGGRGGGDGSLLGTTVKIRQGPFKGYRGPVVEVKGKSVRVQLEMKIVTVDRDAISDNVATTTSFRDTSRYSMGSETPMHYLGTLLHPYMMTPMRDSGCLLF